MPQENVEVVGVVLKALEESAQDGDPTPELLERCDERVHVDATVRVFNPDTYDGHDGIRRLVREMYDSWEGFYYVRERLLDVGDRVLSLHAIGGRGRSSGARVESQSALLFTLRDGLVTHVKGFSDRREALEAAGLHE